MYRSEDGLFYTLTVALKAAKEPLTCVQLYEQNPEVQVYASTPNRVSDYLGNLYRKKLVTRSMAPKTGGSSARYAYTWKGPRTPTAPPTQYEFDDTTKEPVKFKGEMPEIDVTDEGDVVTITLDEFVVTVRRRVK